MSLSPEIDPARYFGFTDLHGFKDFVGFVVLCAPDMFPFDDWLSPEDQMNVDRAFVGLKYGVEIAVEEKGPSPLLTRCSELIDEAQSLYGAGQNYAGQLKLEEVSALLSKLPSR